MSGTVKRYFSCFARRLMRVCKSSSIRWVRSKHVLTSVGVFLISEINLANVIDDVTVDATVEMIAVAVGSGMIAEEFGGQKIFDKKDLKVMALLDSKFRRGCPRTFEPGSGLRWQGVGARCRCSIAAGS